MATKTRPRVGDTAWFVEWCSALAFLGDTKEVDYDNCTMESRRFPTREAAEQFAREIWPSTTKTFGVVDYWPAEFTAYDQSDARLFPYAGYWEPTADTEYYEGTN